MVTKHRTAEETKLWDEFVVWGNPNASAQAVAGHTSQPATEPAATGASELPHIHEWLRPDNGVIECASCGATRNHYGD
jgi:hypothetical protein